MKYIVDIVKKMPSSSDFNAWTKAPADVIRTLSEVGATRAFIVVPQTKLKFIGFIIGLLNCFCIILKFKRGDIVYLQRYGYYLLIIAKLCKIKGVRLEYIVHDLTFLRFGYKKNGLEVNLLKIMDTIYVHTENMKNKMRTLGFNNDMRVLHLFDYYSEDSMRPIEEVVSHKHEIAFAGNLNKSVFLHELYKTNIPNSVQYNLYGLKPETDFNTNPQMRYCGAFKPEHTGVVEAGWGLLWDGDSIDTCSGDLGKYLKINSSHKLSLYLVCGMPVIIWRQSSLYDWLKNHGVCIAVDSLNEIPKAISQVNNETYEQMTKKAMSLGVELRNGMMLKKVLD